MYANKKFRTASDEMALEIIEGHPFANVISCSDGVIQSSHLPVVPAKDVDRPAVAAGNWRSLRLIGHAAPCQPADGGD
jgi:predicted FMN-binding regulatory protein PaiB